MGGDLNFVISAREFWGINLRLDPLAEWFCHIFSKAKLCDIIPNPLVPIWRNGRIWEAWVAKRLEHFFMDENLGEQVGRFSPWTLNVKFSNHLLVYL